MQKRSVSSICPLVANTTNTVALQANAGRSYLFIRNYTAGNIAIGLKGETLSAITPVAAGSLILLPNEWYESTDNTCPNGAITVYQASGSPTSSILFVEA
jgi:hypothetical protein